MAVALEVPESSRNATRDDLEKLGEAAFFHYPVKRAPFEEGAWDTSIANRGGLWLDDQRGFGGLVRTEMNDGSVGLELMDPNRLNPDFDRHLHGRGSVSGHTFGLDLEVTERTSLVEYLLTL